MKCIVLLNNEIKRVSNERAAEMVKKGQGKYCAKAAWKDAPNTTWVKASVPANSTSEHKQHQQEMRILARTPKDGSRRSRERMKKGA